MESEILSAESRAAINAHLNSLKANLERFRLLLDSRFDDLHRIMTSGSNGSQEDVGISETAIALACAYVGIKRIEDATAVLSS